MWVCHVRQEEGVELGSLTVVSAALQREQLLLSFSLLELIIHCGQETARKWSGERDNVH